MVFQLRCLLTGCLCPVKRVEIRGGNGPSSYQCVLVQLNGTAFSHRGPIAPDSTPLEQQKSTTITRKKEEKYNRLKTKNREPHGRQGKEKNEGAAGAR